MSKVKLRKFSLKKLRSQFHWHFLYFYELFKKKWHFKCQKWSRGSFSPILTFQLDICVDFIQKMTFPINWQKIFTKSKILHSFTMTFGNSTIWQQSHSDTYRRLGHVAPLRDVFARLLVCHFDSLLRCHF